MLCKFYDFSKILHFQSDDTELPIRIYLQANFMNMQQSYGDTMVQVARNIG